MNDTNRIVEEHYRANFEKLVRKLSWNHGHHAAEDMVQETYTRVLTYWNESVGDFNAWFGTVLSNVIKQYKAEEYKP